MKDDVLCWMKKLNGIPSQLSVISEETFKGYFYHGSTTNRSGLQIQREKCFMEVVNISYT
jgi:hypothetical protein